MDGRHLCCRSETGDCRAICLDGIHRVWQSFSDHGIRPIGTCSLLSTPKTIIRWPPSVRVDNEKTYAAGQEFTANNPPRGRDDAWKLTWSRRENAHRLAENGEHVGQFMYAAEGYFLLRFECRAHLLGQSAEHFWVLTQEKGRPRQGGCCGLGASHDQQASVVFDLVLV